MKLNDKRFMKREGNMRNLTLGKRETHQWKKEGKKRKMKRRGKVNETFINGKASKNIKKKTQENGKKSKKNMKYRKA